MIGASVIALDADGDWALAHGKLLMLGGADAIRQHLQIRLQTFLGEWFLDTTVGIPWYRDILTKNPSFPVVQAALKSTILDTPGVLRLLAFELDYVNPRTLTLVFEAETDDGVIDFTKVISV